MKVQVTLQWAYWSAQIFFLCLEFTHVHATGIQRTLAEAVQNGTAVMNDQVHD